MYNVGQWVGSNVGLDDALVHRLIERIQSNDTSPSQAVRVELCRKAALSFLHRTNVCLEIGSASKDGDEVRIFLTTRPDAHSGNSQPVDQLREALRRLHCF